MRCVIKVESGISPDAGTIVNQRLNHGETLAAGLPQKSDTPLLMLGGYTLLERIGTGGMGQVFRAVHRRMDRIVAIKTLPLSSRHDPAVIARFEREVRIATRLEHPNIIAAFDADESNGIRFLVMQYVEGQDLSTVVKESGPLPAGQAINYILQAARGLEFAHAAGVVHRDIKPANLLLGKDGVVKILDMGLARMESPDEVDAQAERTETGTVMGTIDYMAPEQALNARTADARADIYSLGCSLFYLLTGQPIYKGESLTGRLIAHQTKPIPDLCERCPTTSAELEGIFRKMVAKKVDERYQSMTQVIADLERLIAEQPSSAGFESTIKAPVPSRELASLCDAPATATIGVTTIFPALLTGFRRRKICHRDAGG